jgi:hypothetical protein
MQFIHNAFCMAVFTFGAIAFFLLDKPVYFSLNPTEDSEFYPMFPVLGILGIAAGLFLFRKQISIVPELQTFDSKIVRYQTAFIIQSAFLEGASLMNIVAFLKSANLVFIVVAIIAFLFLLMSFPGKQRVINDLKLEYPDTEKL